MKEYMVTVSKTGTCIVQANSIDDAMLLVKNNNADIQWDDWWEPTDAHEAEK